MNALRVWIPLVAFVVAVARAENTNSLPTGSVTSNTIPGSASNTVASTCITIDGVTYQDVRWGRLTPATVTIYHKSGIASIPLWKLPPDLQQRFGYDPQKAVAWQKVEQQQAAAWQKAQQQKAEMEKWSKTLLTEPFKVGMVGVSCNGEFRVVQVVGPNEMLAEVSTEQYTSGIGTTVIDRNNPYGRGIYIPGPSVKGSKPHVVWVKGISTQGLIDGAWITRKDVFKVTGTKTYTTAGGTATIFMLEPVTSVSPP